MTIADACEARGLHRQALFFVRAFEAAVFAGTIRRRATISPMNRVHAEVAGNTPDVPSDL
jgi:hypothetical protein